MRYYVRATGGHEFLVTCMGPAEGRRLWSFWHRKLRAVFGQAAIYAENLPGFKEQGRPVILLWTGALVEPD